MKRFLIFALLGPFIAWLAILAASDGQLYKVPVAAISSFIFSYVLGIVPALIVCFVDWKLRDWSWRPLYCALAGFFAPQPLFIVPFRDFGLEGVLLLGCLGAFSAAVCSWLSGEKQNGSKNA